LAESSWSTLYDEAKSGTVAGIAEGSYEVEVVDVRALATSRLLFLDLRVLSGPLAGRLAQVNLYLPEAGNRGAGFHFRNKIMGFGDLTETFKQMDSAQDVASALDILADALTGRKVQADIELRSDGEYAGTNQLAKTKPADGVLAPATAAPVQPAAQAAPVTAPEPAAQPEPAMAGEIPF
jgi:hypothetical protein